MRIRLGNRIRSLLMTLIVCLSAISSYLVVTHTPDPIVDRMIEEDAARLAIKWKENIVDSLESGADTFRVGRLSGSDIAFLNLLLEGSDIYRFKLMSRDGTVFWASRPGDIGSAETADYFRERVAQGEIVTFLLTKPPAEVDNFNYAGHLEHRVLDIAEVYVPVIGDGGILGAIEFYTDTTETRETYVAIIQTALFMVCAAGMAALLLVVVGIARAGNRAMHELQVSAEKERSLLEDQMRLSREVQLLGELNEWLQSAASLDELFDMVSRFLGHMIPGSAGTVYVYSNSRDVLDGRAAWNGGRLRAQIHASECWGLRRGRTYGYSPDDLHFACAHVEDDERESLPYYCFPILAHGETVGLMHISARPGFSEQEFAESRRLAQMCAEQISMAVANVRMRDQLLDQSIRDPLTGLYNRRHMMDHLRRFVENARRRGDALCVLSLDVDHFKKFNDNHGHDAGDMVLRAVGSVLDKACDGDEIACRIGGEEFLLILPETPASRAIARAEALRKSIEEVRVRYGEKTLPRISASIGLSVFPNHGQAPQELIRASDDALYEAKAMGRNRVVLALAPGGDDLTGGLQGSILTRKDAADTSEAPFAAE